MLGGLGRPPRITARAGAQPVRPAAHQPSAKAPVPTAQPSSLPDPCAPLPCCIFSSCAPVRTTLHPFSCLAASHAEGQPLPSAVHSPAPGRPCSVDGHTRERTERFSLLCFTRLRQFPSQLCLTPGVPRPHPIRGTCSRYSHIPTPPSTFSPGSPRPSPNCPPWRPLQSPLSLQTFPAPGGQALSSLCCSWAARRAHPPPRMRTV